MNKKEEGTEEMPKILEEQANSGMSKKYFLRQLTWLKKEILAPA